MFIRSSATVALGAILLLTPSCGRHQKMSGGKARPAAVAYRVTGGRAAVLRGGVAYPPPGAPTEVKRAIAAANRIAGLPYKWGGGHAVLNDSGYDCSGAASYVLRNAGLLEDQMPSRGFLNYGKKGDGKWITVCARKGHVYLIIAGLRFDTQGTTSQDGPRWRSVSRSTKGHSLRHPRGL